MLAFQKLVTRLLPLYCQLTAHAGIAALVSLVMLTEPWKPVFHSFTTTYLQTAA
jgi:hypothetical protein